MTCHFGHNTAKFNLLNVSSLEKKIGVFPFLAKTKNQFSQMWLTMHLWWIDVTCGRGKVSENTAGVPFQTQYYTKVFSEMWKWVFGLWVVSAHLKHWIFITSEIVKGRGRVFCINHSCDVRFVGSHSVAISFFQNFPKQRVTIIHKWLLNKSIRKFDKTLSHKNHAAFDVTLLTMLPAHCWYLFILTDLHRSTHKIRSREVTF